MEVSFTVLRVTRKPAVLPGRWLHQQSGAGGRPVRPPPARERPPSHRGTLPALQSEEGRGHAPRGHVSRHAQQRRSFRIFGHRICWYSTLLLKFSFNFNFNSIDFLKFTQNKSPPLMSSSLGVRKCTWLSPPSKYRVGPFDRHPHLPTPCRCAISLRAKDTVQVLTQN